MTTTGRATTRDLVDLEFLAARVARANDDCRRGPGRGLCVLGRCLLDLRAACYDDVGLIGLDGGDSAALLSSRLQMGGSVTLPAASTDQMVGLMMRGERSGAGPPALPRGPDHRRGVPRGLRGRAPAATRREIHPGAADKGGPDACFPPGGHRRVRRLARPVQPRAKLPCHPIATVDLQSTLRTPRP